MFKDTNEGKTNFCLACELEARGIQKLEAHTCGLKTIASTPENERLKGETPENEKLSTLGKCCEKCKREKDEDYWYSENEPIYDCINNNCPCHTKPQEVADWEANFEKEFEYSNFASPYGLSASDFILLKSFITRTLEQENQKLLKEMLEECDRIQNEDGRLLVEYFINKLKSN